MSDYHCNCNAYKRAQWEAAMTALRRAAAWLSVEEIRALTDKIERAR